MDLITLTLAVKKALEELGVKKEPGKVLWKGKLTVDDGLSVASLDIPIGLEVGKTYTVTTDSGTYTSIAKEYGNTIVIGNTAMMDGDDSGESYCIVEAVADEAGAILDINGGTSATISAPETIHPIDPKFIPGAVLPVVELSMTKTLTAEEQARLTAYANQATPIMVKVLDEGVVAASSIGSYWLNPESGLHLFLITGIGVLSQAEDGTWSAQWE